MKKTFKLTHPKIKPARLVEAVRRDVKKYLKRESRKDLPEGVDFWDFDCKYGPTVERAEVIHPAEISKCIGEAEAEGLESFYLEILAKPGRRTKKPVATETDD
jgi:hypothetical protein